MTFLVVSLLCTISSRYFSASSSLGSRICTILIVKCMEWLVDAALLDTYLYGLVTLPTISFNGQRGLLIKCRSISFRKTCSQWYLPLFLLSVEKLREESGFYMPREISSEVKRWFDVVDMQKYFELATLADYDNDVAVVSVTK